MIVVCNHLYLQQFLLLNPFVVDNGCREIRVGCRHDQLDHCVAVLGDKACCDFCARRVESRCAVAAIAQ